jgi:hypothetical protein
VRAVEVEARWLPSIVQAAEEDYRKLIRTPAARLLGDDAEWHRSA